jgi:hypothetical protein
MKFWQLLMPENNNPSNYLSGISVNLKGILK